MGNVFDKEPFLTEITTRKIFVKRDIFIYATLLFLVLSLFLAIVIPSKKLSPGFKVEIDGQVVLTHVYGKDFELNEQFSSSVVIENVEKGYAVKILTQNGFNLLLVNENDKTVKMQDSDCPSRNCVHMQEIQSSGAIYCAPRALKITPLEDSEFIPLVAGGQG